MSEPQQMQNIVTAVEFYIPFNTRQMPSLKPK